MMLDINIQLLAMSASEESICKRLCILAFSLYIPYFFGYKPDKYGNARIQIIFPYWWIITDYQVLSGWYEYYFTPAFASVN